MIKVVISKYNDTIHAFEISGHANSGPYGYDLVCAAVSAVSFGSVNAVSALCETELIVDQHGEGGYLYVELPNSLTGERLEKANIILEAMIESLKTIERQYGEFIKIILE
ncbi:ribosomal-processing cysteine protease Prp [Pseudogracilibacillus sp. ICA-222130]|uniref:ribosomal-processing cysteine protease Prp n=1 Tax=Pseudogracilibacillus sp. ICA-222130 TaxID=3134655 RepID=UPI0030C042C2